MNFLALIIGDKFCFPEKDENDCFFYVANRKRFVTLIEKKDFSIERTICAKFPFEDLPPAKEIILLKCFMIDPFQSGANIVINFK